MVLNPKTRKLQRDEQLDKIKDQMVSREGLLPADVREPLNSSLTGPKIKHSVSERTVMALHLPLRKPLPGPVAAPIAAAEAD